jgi:hypothetical protein
LFATVIGAIASANLTPASGRQDHTTSPSAGQRIRLRAAASTASRPTFVTIASAPLRDGTAQIMELIWVERERESFCSLDWTAQISLNTQENLA